MAGFLNLFEALGVQEVVIIHGEGTLDESRRTVEAHIQPRAGYFEVETPIWEGDIVEMDDPRGGRERRVVRKVEVYSNTPSPGTAHTEVTWGEAPQPSAALPPNKNRPKWQYALGAVLVIAFLGSLVKIMFGWPLPFKLFIALLLVAGSSAIAFTGIFVREIPQHWIRAVQVGIGLMTLIATALGANALMPDKNKDDAGPNPSSGISTPSPEPASPTPTSPSPTSSPSPSLTPKPTPAQTTKVTRTTIGKQPLVLQADYTADLDTEGWNVKRDRDNENDIEFWHGTLIGNQYDNKTYLAVVSGPRKYDTCKEATNYAEEISKEETKKGVTVCVKLRRVGSPISRLRTSLMAVTTIPTRSSWRSSSGNDN
jgi:hypothetical protein